MSALLLGLMVGWGGAGTAWAQESEFAPEGSNCADPWPISGTAGVRNAGEAIQANANTYSASSFANRHLNSVDEDSMWEIGDGDWVMGVSTALNVTYGAADLVVHHPKALEYPDDCEAKWRTASKPLDLQAANVGLVFKNGPVGLFYATSFTWAAPAYGDQFTRLLMTSFVAPAYVLSASVLSGPLDLLTKGPLESTNDFSSTRLEWMGGATLELDRVHASAAYLSSKGAYVQASEEVLGAYIFAAIRPETGTVFEGGFDRFDPSSLGNASEALGMLSLAYQDVPFFLMGAAGGQRAIERLQVGRINQQNLGGVFDINARYRIAPSPSVSELTAGLHTPAFHARRDGSDREEGVLLLVQGGVVTAPAAWAQGNGPATLPSGRVALGGRFDDADMRFSIYINDPDQLQLYPFARNAVSYQVMVSSAY